MTDKHNSVALAERTAPDMGIMHPLVAKMIERDVTPESLEKILNLQREYQKDQAKRAFDAALVEMKRDLPKFLAHDKLVEFDTRSGGKTSYTHTTLAGAMEAVTPILVNYGFSISWTPSTSADGKMVTVTCELTHRLGHTKPATISAPPDTSGLKNPAQAIASTITILERYTALGLLGLSTKDMGDVNSEAAPAPAADRVDTSRNLKAMGACVKAGKKAIDVVDFVGKPVQKWTSADLEKLRAWLKGPAAPTAPAAEPKPEPVDEKITDAQFGILKALRTQYKLTPAQMVALCDEAVGRHLDDPADIKKSEFEKISSVFERLEKGALTMKDGKVQYPPAPKGKPAVDMAQYGGKTEEQLNAEADADGAPF